MSLELNDSIDDLLGGPMGEVRSEPVRQAPAFTPAAERWQEGCPKCGGSGRVRWGMCFSCKGAGKVSFKTSPAARAKGSVQRAGRKARNVAEDMAAFKAREPEVFAWLNAETAKPQPFGFAVSMVETIAKFGDLTEGQLAACQKIVARNAAMAADRAQKAAGEALNDTAGVDRLKAAFDQAIAYSAQKGLKRSPKITVGGMVISPAKAASQNPGALYVKESGTYLGKVADGRFFASRECGPAQQAKVMEFIANPKEASEVYGQETGTCCICNATLTSEWKLRGIGPICAEKFGW